MRLACLCFFIGILSVAFSAQLPSLMRVLLASMLFFLLAYLFTRKKLIAMTLHGCAWFLLGVYWFSLQAVEVLKNSLPEHLISRTLVVHAKIASVPQIKQNFMSFNAELKLPNLAHTLKARLSWIDAQQIPYQGEHWQLAVRLKPPHGLINPGSFNFEQWLFSHRVQAVGYVTTSVNNQLLQNSHFLNIDYWRQRIAEQIQKLIKEEATLGIVQALAIGLQQNISDEQWHTMRLTGTNHLVAVAGLHIGFVALFVFKLARLFLRFFPRVTLYLPASQASGLLALVICSCYAMLAGMGLPTQRALIMMSVFLFTLIWRRYLHRWQAYCLALWMVLIFDPLSVLEQSFWLSFGAVAVILFAMHAEMRKKPHWQQWLYLQWVIMLGLLSFSLLFFQQFAPLSWLANLIAVLVVGFLVLPFVLMGTFLLFILPSLAQFILWLAAEILFYLWEVLAWFAQQDWSIWQPAQPPLSYLLFASIGMLLLMAPKGFPLRWLSLFWFLPLLTYQPAKLQLDEVRMTVLDVGQGLSLFIQTKEHTLLYDTGPKFGESDAAERVILPFLKSLGIEHLDVLIISHADMDHAGGYGSLIKNVSINTILTSNPQKLLQLANRKIENCWAGQKWQWDNVQFEMLHPAQNAKHLDNNSSCVLRISVKNKWILLPGDIEKITETELVNKKLPLRADMLVAPHHGSKTSSTEPFLTAVQPRFVIVSAGFYNRFRQPHKKVIRRYQQRKIEIYETSKGGATTVYLSPSHEIRITQERVLHPRFWYRP